ncbi:hypothetical protein IOD13_03140 [Brevibacterium casei]|nr:hypothetical protein [Brevibacterium casei]
MHARRSRPSRPNSRSSPENRADRAPGAGAPIGRFFDLYFRVGRAVMENPLAACRPRRRGAPSQRFRAVMDRRNLEYYLRYDQQVREVAAESPSYDLVDWSPEG